MKYYFLIVAFTVAFTFSLAVGFSTSAQITERETDDMRVCTQEAKLCPDGSYVSRTGPNCEFALCPAKEFILGDPERSGERANDGDHDQGFQYNETDWDFINKSSDSPTSDGQQSEERDNVTGQPSPIGTAESDRAGLADGAPPILINAVEVRGWDPVKKQNFLESVKTHAELRSQQDLENFAAGVLLKDKNIEELELAHEGLKMGYRMPAKLFGIFNFSFTVRAEVTADKKVKVRFPWYSFLYKKHVVGEEVEAEIEAGLADLDDWTVLSADGAAITGGVIASTQTALSNAYDKSHRLLRGTK